MAAANEGAPSLSSMSQKAILQDITACITKQAQHSTFACGGTVSHPSFLDQSAGIEECCEPKSC